MSENQEDLLTTVAQDFRDMALPQKWERCTWTRSVPSAVADGSMISMWYC